MKLAPRVTQDTLSFPESYPCEHCETSVDHGKHHSFILGLNCYSRSQGYAYRQCDAVQHFACTHEHAVAQVKRCIAEHVPELPPFQPDPLRQIPAACALCGEALGDTSYRYTLTYAMAGHDGDGNPYNPYHCDAEHWCCSLAHAQEAAEACLDEHLEDGPHG